MTIFTTRNAKGSELTYTEGDNNWLLSVPRIDSMADLKNTQADEDGQTIFLPHYYPDDNAIGKSYTWNATSTATANDGTIVAVTGVPVGRWEMNFSGALDIRWFGAGESQSEATNTTAIQAAIDSLPATTEDTGVVRVGKGGRGAIYTPTGRFSISTITVYDNLLVYGDGDSSVLIISGSIEYAVLDGSTSFDALYNLRFRDLRLEGSVGTETLIKSAQNTIVGRTIDTFALTESSFEGIAFYKGGIGFDMQGGWSNTFINCHFRQNQIALSLREAPFRTPSSDRPTTAECNDNTFLNCQWNVNELSVRLRYGTGNEWIGCAAFTGDTYHFHISEKSRHNKITGGTWERTGKGMVLIRGGHRVTHNSQTYRCISAHTSDASTEPGIGASWATVWVADNDWDTERIWATGITYGDNDAVNTIFDGADFHEGADPFPGWGGSIPHDANYREVTLDGDTNTSLIRCTKGNLTSGEIGISNVSDNARILWCTYVDDTINIISGTPVYFHVGDTFGSNNLEFKKGNVVVENDFNLYSSADLTYGVLEVDHSNKIFYAQRQTGSVTLTAAATFTQVLINHDSTKATAVLFPQNASAATLMATGSVYAVVQANNRIGIWHNAAAGGEIFTWQLM